MVRMVGNQLPQAGHVLCSVVGEGGVTGSVLQRSPFYMFLRILFSTSDLSNAAVIYLTRDGGCEKDGKIPQTSAGVSQLYRI